MKISVFKNFGALNSGPVFDAFIDSLKNRGFTVTENDLNADVAVIWSVLWHGRMERNLPVWQYYKSRNRPVIVLEVGALNRGTLWKVAVNGINGSGYFGPKGMDGKRRQKLNLSLKPWKTGEDIIICLQHGSSEQWKDMPETDIWVNDVISKIRQKTSRRILIRSHPRYRYKSRIMFSNVEGRQPRGEGEDLKNLFVNAGALINWNSNPAVIAAIEGIPVFVGPTSLAADVGNLDLDNINEPLTPDREQWLNDLAYTEWTVDEIRGGEPLDRVLSALTL